MEFKIIMPYGAMGASESDTELDNFLREFAVKHQEEGEWAEKYGTNIKSDKVLMNRYCWCEKATCPYCFDLDEEKVTEKLKLEVYYVILVTEH